MYITVWQCFPSPCCQFERLSRVLLGRHAGSNYLQPLLGPLSNMLQMLQECSQLELALRVLVNSYGSCLQHVTSNVMDMKLSVQVWLPHIQRRCPWSISVVTSGQKTYLQNSFSSMIPKCWRNTTYGWMSFKSRRLQLWTPLPWRSWTRWVSCPERLLSNFINLSIFLNRCIDFLWDVGLQLEGGRLRFSHRTLYAPLQSRNLQNTVEGYRQYLAKLWQNLGRYQEHSSQKVVVP